MARRLAGFIRNKDGVIEASVPERRGATRRVHQYFATRPDAERWCAAAVEALYAGEPVPLSTRPRPVASDEVARGTDRHFFVRGARAWHTERYVLMRTAGADRAQKTDDLVRLHILPFFTTMITRPDQFTRELVIQFLLRLTGSRDACYPLPDAAAIAGKSERHIRRLIERDELPVRGTDATGRRLVRLGDLETALGVRRLRAAYARSTVKGILDTLRQIEKYLVTQGILERAVSTGLALPRIDDAALRRPRREERDCVPIEDVAVIAQQLHIVHQLALWLLRICGLRISEAYGIRVGDIIDFGASDRHGIIAIERQGGRGFLVYDDNGDVVTVGDKDTLKTEGSVRVLMVPRSLMELIRLVVNVFHTDPETGRVDLDARLVPGIQRADASGQASFRSALTTALGAAERDGDIDSMFRPHDLRAALITDLSDSDVNDILRRRYAGHLPGTDVHSGYIRKLRGLTAFEAVADEIEQAVDSTVSTLITPTAWFPQFGRTHPIRDRLDEVRSLLIDAGALLEVLDGDEPLLDAAEVAIELGCHESHARRLMRSGVLPTDDSTGQRRVAHADLEAYLDTKLPNLRDVADRTGVEYHRLYRIVGQLDLQLDRDPVSDEFAIDGDTETALLAEVERVDELRTRACTVVDVASRLHKAHSTVRKMIRAGDLIVDAETDASGARYITNDSIDAYLAQM